MGAILDPGGIFTGNGPLADTGSPVPYQPQQPSGPSFWNTQDGFLGQLLGMGAKGAGELKSQADEKAWRDKHTASPGARAELLKGAYNPDAKPAEAPFQPQWSYTAGKGPQWIEPKQTYARDGGDQWKTEVNTGPAKGNRF